MNEDLDLVILHSYVILEYDLKHFYIIFVYSNMIPEHFCTILYETKTFIPVIPIF